MILTHDYSKFTNLHDCTKAEHKSLKYDFCVSLMNTLKMLGCSEYIYASVAETLFMSMSSMKTYYHTPVHIMSIFNVAKENNIELDPVQELAIFFHDAIYRPGSKDNERLSCEFMKSLISDTGISSYDIENAVRYISWTAFHLKDDFYNAMSDKAKTLLDLDMAGFSANPSVYKKQNEMIELEFYNPECLMFSDITEEQFLNGRLGFLNKLKTRKSIYRSEYFLDKFESRAQTNLSNSIIETQLRLDSLKK
jgi:predicted metal-dependent HD superfamily phosphohydrolase